MGPMQVIGGLPVQHAPSGGPRRQVVRQVSYQIAQQQPLVTENQQSSIVPVGDLQANTLVPQSLPQQQLVQQVTLCSPHLAIFSVH